jgi:uncharacterized protein (TIGR00251 family)
MAQIQLKVIPGARRTEVAGLHGDAVKIRVQAPPVDGKANQALHEFLAQTLGVRLSEVSLLRGEKSPLKTFEIQGLTREAILENLLPQD